MAPIHFYFAKDVDYLNMLENFQNTEGYEKCREKCEDDFEGDEKKCLAICESDAHDPTKVVAKLVIAPKGDPLAGIVFTEAFREPLTAVEMEKKALLPVTTVEVGNKVIDELDIVNVTVEDLLSPHSRLEGKTVCETVGALTDQALTAMDYAVNGHSNPRFVLSECMDIRARVKLGQVAAENAEDIIDLLDDQAYDEFCSNRRHEGVREKCEVVAPWMKAGDDDTPASVCSLMQGRFYSVKCGVNTQQRDRIKSYIRKKVNDCIAEMGCVYNSKKFMRRHTKGNFPVGSVPTHMCCKRSLKAAAKSVLRMNRVYKMVQGMSVEEQVGAIQNTTMTEEQKKHFIESVQESDAMGERLVADLQIDRPTQVFLETFAVMVRSSLGEELQQFMQLGEMEPKTDADAEKKLVEITGSGEKASHIMAFLKSAAAGVASMIITVSGLLLKASLFFAKKGFNLVKWILNHPSTVVWMTYGALLFKKKLCQEISLKIFGDPKIVEVGLLAKSGDLYEKGIDNAQGVYQFIKRSFLSFAYQSTEGGSFSRFVDKFANVVESGLLVCFAGIPVYGPALVVSIKSTGALSIVKDAMKSAITEGSKYAVTALLIKEAGEDMVQILIGTCIMEPDAIKKLTVNAAFKEVDQGLQQNLKRPVEFNPFLRQQQKAAAESNTTGPTTGSVESGGVFYSYIASLKTKLI